MTELNNNHYRNWQNFFRHGIIAVAAIIITIKLTEIIALQEYFNFIMDFPVAHGGYRLFFQCLLMFLVFILVILMLHRVAFFYFLIPPERNSKIIYVVFFLRLFIIFCPTFFLCYLIFEALNEDQPLFFVVFAITTVTIGIVLQITLAFTTLHKNFTQNRVGTKAQKYRNDLHLISASGYALTFSICVLLFYFVGIIFYFSETSNFFGGLGAYLFFLLLLSLSYSFLQFLRHLLRFPVVLVVLLIALAFQLIPNLFFPGEIRHTSLPQPASTPSSILGEIFRGKEPPPQVLSLPDAFASWLKSRAPGIDGASGNTGTEQKRFPVFLVAAQGGGQYAAYHSALFLARLYDRCPKFGKHLFAISGVSGGSVGAAFFTEMLRSIPFDSRSCGFGSDTTIYEQKTREFFKNDFVAPIITHGLFFDLPRYLTFPSLGSSDRATALERSLEEAWKDNHTFQLNAGLDKEFYGRWRPERDVPALFLNSTLANYGVPLVFSQIQLSRPFQLSLMARLLSISTKMGTTSWAESGKNRETLANAIRDGEYTRPPYFNVLDYRPDIQLKVSTAAVASARFPYVTPPAYLNIKDNEADRDSLLQKAKSIQIIDGGFVDNSGIRNLVEIIQQLRENDQIKNLVENIDFYIISFGHAKRILQAGSSEGHPELLAPIQTFEAIRQANRFSIVNQSDLKKNTFFINLFDHKFEAPLSWALSARTLSQIENRSGGESNVELCCRLEWGKQPGMWGHFMRNRDDIYLAPEIEAISNIGPGLPLLYTPNRKEFDKIIQAIISYY